MAKHHYLISKTVEGEKTVTRIDALDENEQITELARMLGGVKITDAVIENAKEMKALAMKS
jgi:DNA repair protein RecN (Recombination protein N)